MKIALLGMGTIGSGVYELLEGHPEIDICRVFDRRVLPGAAEALRTERIEDILADSEIDTVVELLGGVEPARSYAYSALRTGKNVVSANKLMLSADFALLLRTAREKGVQMRISASVGGGIPWLPNLLRARRTAQIVEIGGIVNGTTNFILDAMQRQGIEYKGALTLAQRAGYAEANPSADVDGEDARCKLAISASIAFDALVDGTGIHTAGIRGLRREDVAYFAGQGLVCRLLAQARRTETGVSACVEPALLPGDAREASILRNDNCISFASAASGTLSFIGQGAGKLPTAFAVVNDLEDLLRGEAAPAYVTNFRAVAVDNAQIARHYYVRTAAPLPFAAEPVGKDAWLTAKISVEQMHEYASARKKAEPEMFFAGLREE